MAKYLLLFSKYYYHRDDWIECIIPISPFNPAEKQIEANSFAAASQVNTETYLEENTSRTFQFALQWHLMIICI